MVNWFPFLFWFPKYICLGGILSLPILCYFNSLRCLGSIFSLPIPMYVLSYKYGMQCATCISNLHLQFVSKLCFYFVICHAHSKTWCPILQITSFKLLQANHHNESGHSQHGYQALNFNTVLICVTSYTIATFRRLCPYTQDVHVHVQPRKWRAFSPKPNKKTTE
jgi:hypothetical protein